MAITRPQPPKIVIDVEISDNSTIDIRVPDRVNGGISTAQLTPEEALAFAAEIVETARLATKYLGEARA